MAFFSGMQGFTTDAPEEVNQPFKDFKSLVSKAEIHRNPMGGNKVKFKGVPSKALEEEAVLIAFANFRVRIGHFFKLPGFCLILINPAV